MMVPETKNRKEAEEREKIMLRKISAKDFREHQLKVSPEVLALEEIRKLCEESTDPPMITKLRQLPENRGEMMSTMTCLKCKRFPDPCRRYICPEGHILCSECGMDSEKNHEFKCLVQYGVGDDEEIKERTGLTRLSQKNLTTCFNSLRSCPGDPIYIAFWHSATWSCPFKDKGCREKFQIIGFYLHVPKCPYRPVKSMQKKQTETTMFEQDERLPMQMQEKKVEALELERKVQDTVEIHDVGEENMPRKISPKAIRKPQLQTSPELLAVKEIIQISEEPPEPPMITKLRQTEETMSEQDERLPMQMQEKQVDALEYERKNQDIVELHDVGEENMLRKVHPKAFQKPQLQTSPELLALEEIIQIYEEPPEPLIITKLRQLPENNWEMMSTMMCLKCKRFPAPERRYICPEGHILCSECGMESEKNHEFKCLAQYDVGDDDFTTCLNTLRSCPGDPIYIAFWHSATWQCPFKENGCNEKFQGTSFYLHVPECPYRDGKLMRK